MIRRSFLALLLPLPLALKNKKEKIHNLEGLDIRDVSVGDKLKYKSLLYTIVSIDNRGDNKLSYITVDRPLGT